METLLRHAITALVREYQWDEKRPAPCVCAFEQFSQYLNRIHLMTAGWRNEETQKLRAA